MTTILSAIAQVEIVLEVTKQVATIPSANVQAAIVRVVIALVATAQAAIVLEVTEQVAIAQAATALEVTEQAAIVQGVTEREATGLAGIQLVALNQALNFN